MASPNLQVAAPSVANRRGWPAIGRVPPRLTEHAIQIQDDARQLLELYRLPSAIRQERPRRRVPDLCWFDQEARPGDLRAIKLRGAPSSYQGRGQEGSGACP
jgi:hypothetical protein